MEVLYIASRLFTLPMWVEVLVLTVCVHVCLCVSATTSAELGVL